MSDEVIHTEHILVVDDLATNRFLLNAILSEEGFPVEECHDGVACLEYCLKQQPALVLLDIMMPDLDGIVVLRTLRQRFSREALPIVMVTTKSEGKYLKEALESGANDYVIKPLDREVLLARVQNQLLMRRTHRLLREKEDALRKLGEIQKATGDVLSDALLVHDETGHVILANDKVGLLCRGGAPKTVEECLRRMFGGEFEGELAACFEQVRANTAAIINTELRHEGAVRRYVRVTSNPIFIRDQSPHRLWVWTDLTHTRELEREVNQKVKLETVGLFAAGVAHNFNNILGGITGAADLLNRMKLENNRARKCVDIIQRGAASGAVLTRKMSSMVHRETTTNGDGDTELTLTVNRVIEELQGKSGSRISFETSLASELPSVNLNLDNLHDIIENVILNAVEAITEVGRVKIAATSDPAGKFVSLSIRDSGIGMDTNTLERAFEPFFSTKNLDVKNGVSIEGNGLGLWKVYSLLKAAGGDVKLESNVGEGTEVTLVLPTHTA